MRRWARGNGRTAAPAIAEARPTTRVDLLLQSGVFDHAYYAAAAGREFASIREAARHCVRVGMPAGLTPNPLLRLGSLPKPVQRQWGAGNVAAILAHLRSRAGMAGRLSPAFHPAQVSGTEDEKRAHPGGALGLFLSTADDATVLPHGSEDRPELTLGELREALVAFDRAVTAGEAGEPPILPGVGRELDWQRIARQERVPGRISIVIPTYEDSRMTVAAVAAALQDTDDLDVEVVVVDNGSARTVGAAIVAATLGDPRVRYLRLPQNLNFATGCNLGFAHTTGAVALFLNNDTRPYPGWLADLIPHLEDPEVRGVQPLLVYPDDTIQTAGTVFLAPDHLPCHFLVGHPPEDALRASRGLFHAVTAAAMAVRADEFAQLHGFDPVFRNGMEDVDYCLRAVRRFGGGFAVEPRAKVTHLEGKSPGRSTHILSNRREFAARWRGSLPVESTDRYQLLGLEVAHLAADAPFVPAARPVVVRPARSGLDQARLRWGLKLPSHAGPRGDRWGDTHFAEGLGQALERLGQDVVTYRHGSHVGSAAHLDDVVLGIRGLDVITPMPGKVNILWVISHPGDVAIEEFQGFDLVYAASERWAREMTARSGRPVLPLLQAVDVTTLPGADEPLGQDVPLFVGSNRTNRDHQTVLGAVRSGVEVAVHGPGWESVLPDHMVRSEYVPNARLKSLYRQHGLVLSDHWSDMADHGFIANRVFDAVAAGARVVSDHIPGIDEMFGGAVRTYATVDELAHLCSPAGRSEFPSDRAMARIADEVARDHSFDVRARTLSAAVRDILAGSDKFGSRGPLGHRGSHGDRRS